MTLKEYQKNSSLGFMTRLIYDIVLATTWRPGQLSNLEISDVTKTKKQGKCVYEVRSMIGTSTGFSKTEQEGIKAVSDKPSFVTIWLSGQLNGKICIYDYIEK